MHEVSNSSLFWNALKWASAGWKAHGHTDADAPMPTWGLSFLLMKTDPWMPLWIGDYLRDTMHLTTIQHGGYLMVLMALWTSPSGKLPFDEETLLRISRMSPEEWSKNHLVIKQFLTVENGEFFQKRLLHERLKTEEIRAKRAEAGRQGGRPRKAIGFGEEEKAKRKQNESKTKVSHNHNHNSTTVGAVEPSAPPPNGEHQAFIRGWCDSYQQVLNVGYTVDGGRDGKAVKDLLKMNIPSEELLEMAKLAWKRQSFAGAKSRTIHGFRHNINEIKTEVYGSRIIPDSKGVDRNRGTFNEGKAAQYANAYAATKPVSNAQ